MGRTALGTVCMTAQTESYVDSASDSVGGKAGALLAAHGDGPACHYRHCLQPRERNLGERLKVNAKMFAYNDFEES